MWHLLLAPRPLKSAVWLSPACSLRKLYNLQSCKGERWIQTRVCKSTVGSHSSPLIHLRSPQPGAVGMDASCVHAQHDSSESPLLGAVSYSPSPLGLHLRFSFVPAHCQVVHEADPGSLCGDWVLWVHCPALSPDVILMRQTLAASPTGASCERFSLQGENKQFNKLSYK